MPYLTTILILLVIILILLELRRVKKTVVYQSAKRKGVEEKKNKILEELTLRGAQGKITNNDVEKMLGVSDASATNYLQELEDEGKIKQVGETGRGVYYELK